jgi:hypothetical protein
MDSVRVPEAAISAGTVLRQGPGPLPHLDTPTDTAKTEVRGGSSAPRRSPHRRIRPGGGRLSYFDTKQGVSPTGSGALFAMDADGGEPLRITPWGFAYDDHA